MAKLQGKSGKSRASLGTIVYFFALRAYIQLLSRVSPKAAAKVAVDLFTTPAITGKRGGVPWSDSIRDLKKEQLDVGENSVIVYLIGSSSKRILLCHGWGGAAAQFSDMANALLAHGFSIITFDAPAHGLSKGKRTDIIDFAEVINAIVKAYGEPYGIVGHSFGAAGSAYALHKFSIKLECCVLISSFGTAVWTFENFGKTLGLTKPVISEMLLITAKKHSKTDALWAEFDVGEMVAGSKIKTMLIHDEGDREIPHDQALHIAAKCAATSLKLVTTNGLGHRRIVKDPTVIGQVTQFLRIGEVA
jgi:pimeloyl-ACP methyl ester carboxylesterase